jgi:hypothetical protein
MSVFATSTAISLFIANAGAELEAAAESRGISVVEE